MYSAMEGQRIIREAIEKVREGGCEVTVEYGNVICIVAKLGDDGARMQSHVVVK